eukprot:CFRG3967T1
MSETESALRADAVLLCVLLSVVGGLCFYLFKSSSESSGSNKPTVAKVDLRSHYGDAIKQRKVNIADLDDAQIRGLFEAGKLSDMQIRTLRANGRL